MQSSQQSQPLENFYYSDSKSGTTLKINFKDFFNYLDKNPKIYLIVFGVLSLGLLITYLRYTYYIKDNNNIDNNVVNSYLNSMYIQTFIVLLCLIMVIISFVSRKKNS